MTFLGALAWRMGYGGESHSGRCERGDGVVEKRKIGGEAACVGAHQSRDDGSGTHSHHSARRASRYVDFTGISFVVRDSPGDHVGDAVAISAAVVSKCGLGRNLTSDK